MKIWNLVAILAISCLLPILAQKLTKVPDLTMRNVAPPAPQQLENQTKVPDLTMRNVAPPAPHQWGPTSLKNQGNDADMTGVKCQKAGGHCVDENDTQICMVPLKEEPDCPKGEQCCKTGVTTVSDRITNLESLTLDNKLTDIYEEVQRTECCVDYNEHCNYWASIRECEANPNYMLVYCRKSCHLCTCGGCVDENKYCSYWASIGECQANPNYMHLYCRLSCHLCGGCVDENKYCSYWASIGECQANPGYMHLYCRKSCIICGCVDYNEHCSYWASIGECDANPGYMHYGCKKSCHICD